MPEAPSPISFSSVPFAAFLAYSPRGTSEESRRSRLICYAIKNDGASAEAGVPMIEYVVQRLVQALAVGAAPDLYPFLHRATLLVPVPKSAPLVSGALWVPQRICLSLARAGFGEGTLDLIERVSAVQKSATASSGNRPYPGHHFESMRVRRLATPPRAITLVDDVITRGSTILGAAAVLRNAFPDTYVSAFALVRTCGLVPDVQAIVNPVAGVVELDHWGNLRRNP